MASALAGLSLAALLAASAQVALADATSLEDLLTGNVLMSESPALLAPIASGGRKTWGCEAERAALTPRVREAELPV
jgi:hypothetical protein